MAQPLTLDEVGVAEVDAAQMIYDLRRKVRTLIDAGNTLADVTYNLLSGSDRPVLDAAINAWRDRAEGSTT